MKNFARFMILGLALALMLSVGLAAVSAQESTLVFAWEQEPTVLNPVEAMTWSSLIDGFTARDMFDWSYDREPFPVMLTEIPTVENGGVVTLDNGNTQITYHLREGMQWSDGEPITTADCIWFSDRVYMDETSGTIQRGEYPNVVESLVAMDDYTMVQTYNTPWPDFLSAAIPVCAYPQHVFEPALDEYGTMDNIPFFSADGVAGKVGYGPYMFDHWSIGSEIVMVKNPYWDGTEPSWDRVVLRMIPDTAQIFNSLEVGEVDVTLNWPADYVDQYSALDGVEVFNTPGVYGDAIWMNYGNNEPGSPLEDVNVRKAIIHAIDRRTLAEQMIGPGVDVPKSWYPSQYWSDDLGFLEYDPELAGQLLDEAGWTRPADDPEGTRVNADGVPLILRWFTTTRQLRMDYQVVVQDYLSDAGIEVQLFPVESTYLFATFNNRGIVSTGSFDLALFALSADPTTPYAGATVWFYCEGIPSPENTSGRNGYGFCDPEYDRLDALVGVTVDPVERLGYAQDAIRHFYDAQFWHGLYLTPTWYAISTATVDVSNVPQGMGTLNSNWFNHIEDWKPAP